MKLSSLAGSLLCLFVFTLAVSSQSISVSGDMRGTITDPSGAVLPNVAVTVVDSQTGLRRTAMTDSSGQFRLTGLQPAIYDVTVRQIGFVSEIRTGVRVAIGDTVIVDFRLKVSGGAVQIEVTDSLAVVDTQKDSQGSNVSERLIANLPLNEHRGWLGITRLTPGTGDSNASAANSDYRVRQTPQSGLSFYGSNGRGNSVTVDGGEANDDTGGVRLNVSQDAVEEFQINGSNYAAELGSAGGASVNIVTKSGTNTLRGSLYGFFRNDALDARDAFAFSSALALDPTFANFRLDATGGPVKNSLSRQQFGGTLGLPIRKEKTFLFLGYEGLRSDAQDSVPLLTHSNIFAPTEPQQSIAAGLTAQNGTMVPCLSGPVGAAVAKELMLPAPNPVTVLPAANCAAILSGVLTINPVASPLSAFAVTQLEKDGGLFPFPTRQHTMSTRLDHHFSDQDRGSVRYSFSHLTESDPDVQALVGFSRGTSVLNWDSTLQGSWFHQFSAHSTNEARLQWNWYQFNVDTNDRGGPGLDVQGYGFFGRGIFLPSHTTARRYELTDNFTVIRGHHSMRMGFYELIRGNNTISDTFFAGRFEFLDLPGNLLSPCLEAPGACNIGSAPAAISTLQSWGLGLPAFYEQGFGNPKYAQTRPLTAGYWQDTWQVGNSLTLNYGLRYEVDSQSGSLNTYKKNLAPRLSFAWDPFHDRKAVVRGGYGIFYSPIYSQIPDVVQTLGNINGARQIANTLVSIRGVPGNSNPYLNSAAIYQVLFAQGRILCGTPPSGQNACISAANLAAPPIGLQVSNSGPLPPGTVLFFGQPDYRNPQSQQASLGVEREIGQGFSVSANYIYVHTTHLPWAVDKNLLPGAPSAVSPHGFSYQDWGAAECGANPGLCFADPTHTILQNNEYASVANSVYNGGILEIRKRFTDRLTLLANYTFSKALDDSTDFNSDYAAFNEVGLRAERSRSDFDQRHKVVFAAVVESPWQHSRAFSDFELSPIVTYNSGHPFNLLAGADVNGDNHFTNDRPPGAPRNSGLGPDYVNFDLRLSRSFNLGEQLRLRFTAEGFNLANHTNYSRVNNIVGPAQGPPFNLHGTASVSPNQPLGFTADLPKREIQFGVRFDF